MFAFTSYLERDLLISINAVASRDHYLSRTFLAISLFLLVMSFPIRKENLLTKIGKNDSLCVYVLHPMLLVLCGHGFGLIGLSTFYTYMAPLIVIVVAYLTIHTLRKCRIINS